MNQLDFVNRLYGKDAEVRKMKNFPKFFHLHFSLRTWRGRRCRFEVDVIWARKFTFDIRKNYLAKSRYQKWVQKSDITTRRGIDEDDFVILPEVPLRRADSDEFIMNELQGEWML